MSILDTAEYRRLALIAAGVDPCDIPCILDTAMWRRLMLQALYDLSQGGGGGTGYITGSVQFYADLPVTVGTPAVNTAYLVRENSGVWFINRKPAGIYVRLFNNGNLNDWDYAGTFPEVNDAQYFRIYDSADPTREVAFNVSGVAAATTRTISVPDKNILLDDASDPRTPTSHTHGNLTNDGKIGSTAGLPVVTATAGAVTTLALGSANQVLKVNSGATGVEFGEGGGIDDYTVITSSQTATNGSRIAADTTAGAFTLTLPATPSNGDTVYILDYAGTFNTNNLIIARNGSNIESLAENMNCNIRNAAFSLVFVGATIGWKVVPYFGSSVNFSSPNPIGNSVPNTGAFTTLTATSLTSGTGAFNNLTATPSSGSALTLTGGTVTASAPVLDASQTWNNSGVTFTGLRFNLAPSASDHRSLIVSLEQSSTPFWGIQSVIGVPPTEAVRIFGGSRGIRIGSRVTSGAGSADFIGIRWQQNTFTMLDGTEFGWSTQPYDSAPNLALHRDAANTLAQRNGTNAQTFRLYNTFTSTTNFERLNIIAQSAASVIIGTEKGSGGGSARGLELRTDNVSRINISATGGIGFFGAAASAQPTAVADATDAASVITQLNALLSRMRTLGLIAT